MLLKKQTDEKLKLIQEAVSPWSVMILFYNFQCFSVFKIESYKCTLILNGANTHLETSLWKLFHHV